MSDLLVQIAANQRARRWIKGLGLPLPLPPPLRRAAEPWQAVPLDGWKVVVGRAPQAAGPTDRAPQAAGPTDRAPQAAGPTGRAPQAAGPTDRAPQAAGSIDRASHDGRARQGDTRAGRMLTQVVAE